MLAKLFEPLLARAARSYQAMVGYELKKYGLRYDDLYDQLYSTVRKHNTQGKTDLLSCYTESIEKREENNKKASHIMFVATHSYLYTCMPFVWHPKEKKNVLSLLLNFTS